MGKRNRSMPVYVTSGRYLVKCRGSFDVQNVLEKNQEGKI